MGLLLNRVRVATPTTGPGTITLGAATAGYRTFAAAGAISGVRYSYVIEDGSDWEVGEGLYTASGPTLTRILEASSTGALLNLTGSASVFISPLVNDLLGFMPTIRLVADASFGLTLTGKQNGSNDNGNKTYPTPPTGQSQSVNLNTTAQASANVYLGMSFLADAGFGMVIPSAANGIRVPMRALQTVVMFPDASYNAEIRSGIYNSGFSPIALFQYMTWDSPNWKLNINNGAQIIDTGIPFAGSTDLIQFTYIVEGPSALKCIMRVLAPNGAVFKTLVTANLMTDTVVGFIRTTLVTIGAVDRNMRFQSAGLFERFQA